MVSKFFLLLFILTFSSCTITQKKNTEIPLAFIHNQDISIEKPLDIVLNKIKTILNDNGYEVLVNNPHSTGFIQTQWKSINNNRLQQLYIQGISLGKNRSQIIITQTQRDPQINLQKSSRDHEMEWLILETIEPLKAQNLKKNSKKYL